MLRINLTQCCKLRLGCRQLHVHYIVNEHLGYGKKESRSLCKLENVALQAKVVVSTMQIRFLWNKQRKTLNAGHANITNYTIIILISWPIKACVNQRLCPPY